MGDTYCIYMHTNLVNGKRYIGQTKHGENPNSRWRNGTHYGENYPFSRAIQKYGWDSFSHEVLEQGLTAEQANEREIYYIFLYDTTNEEKGYNILNGGVISGTKGALGMHWYNNGTDEVLCMESDKPDDYVDGKLSSWNRGKHLTEEHKKAISDAQKGKVISEELRQVLISEGNKRAKKILCIETGDIFNSLREAERVLGISRRGIARVCNGEYSQTNGYHFEYYKEVA